MYVSVYFIVTCKLDPCSHHYLYIIASLASVQNGSFSDFHLHWHLRFNLHTSDFTPKTDENDRLVMQVIIYTAVHQRDDYLHLIRGDSSWLVTSRSCGKNWSAFVCEKVNLHANKQWWFNCPLSVDIMKSWIWISRGTHFKSWKPWIQTFEYFCILSLLNENPWGFRGHVLPCFFLWHYTHFSKPRHTA